MKPDSDHDMDSQKRVKIRIREKVKLKVPPKVKKPWLQEFLEKPFSHPWYFCKEYVETRKWWCLAKSVPVFLATILFAVVIIRNQTLEAETLVENYRDSAEKAIEAEDYEAAILLLRKLHKLQPEKQVHRYNMAICWEKLENQPRTAALMHSIAPVDQLGYPQAHFWVAEKLRRSNSSPNINRSRLKAMEHHYRHAMNDKTLRDRSLGHLTQIYVDYAKLDRSLNLPEDAEKNAKEAIRLYASIQNRGETYWLMFNSLYKFAGRTEQAKTAAEKAIVDLKQRIQQQPQNTRLYFFFTQAAVELNDYPSALKMLEQGMMQAEKADRKRFLEGLALLHCRWFDSIPESQTKYRLELINEAMRFGPDLPKVQTRLAQLVANANEDPNIIRVLENAILEGHAPAIVHLTFADKAVEEQDYAKAIEHYELVITHQPQSVIAMNNLAMTLTKLQPPQLERAEEVINKAVSLAPRSINLLDTRSIVLEQAGNLKGAIRDYEQINRLKPGQIETYERLASLYEKAGFDDLAASARKKIQSLMETPET